MSAPILLAPSGMEMLVVGAGGRASLALSESTQQLAFAYLRETEGLRPFRTQGGGLTSDRRDGDQGGRASHGIACGRKGILGRSRRRPRAVLASVLLAPTEVGSSLVAGEVKILRLLPDRSGHLRAGVMQ